MSLTRCSTARAIDGAYLARVARLAMASSARVAWSSDVTVPPRPGGRVRVARVSPLQKIDIMKEAIGFPVAVRLIVATTRDGVSARLMQDAKERRAALSSARTHILSKRSSNSKHAYSARKQTYSNFKRSGIKL